MIAAIKAFFEALGAFLGFLKDRQLIDAGKAEAKAEADEQAVKDIIDAARPPTTVELDNVRSRFRRD